MTWRNRIRGMLDRRVQVRADNVQNPDVTGDDVVAIQRQVNRYGARYGIQVFVTGRYDEQTIEAVRRFQMEAIGLAFDGFVGPQTARRLHLRLIGDQDG